MAFGDGCYVTILWADSAFRQPGGYRAKFGDGLLLRCLRCCLDSVAVDRIMQLARQLFTIRNSKFCIMVKAAK